MKLVRKHFFFGKYYHEVLCLCIKKCSFRHGYFFFVSMNCSYCALWVCCSLSPRRIHRLWQSKQGRQQCGRCGPKESRREEMILHKKMWWWMMMVMIVVMLMVINVGQRSHIHNLMFFSPSGGLLHGWRLGNSTTVPPYHRTTVPPYHRTTVPPYHRTTVPPYHRTTVPPYRTWFHLYPLVGCWLYPILKMNWYGQHPTSTYKWKWVQYDGTVQRYGTMVR